MNDIQEKQSQHDLAQFTGHFEQYKSKCVNCDDYNCKQAKETLLNKLWNKLFGGK